MGKIADMLNELNVSVLTINEDGARHRCAYENSESGRKLLVENETEEIVKEVFAVWGETPTVEEPVFEEIPEQDAEPDMWDEIANAIREGVNEV